jgi:hypothetical protein
MTAIAMPKTRISFFVGLKFISTRAIKSFLSIEFELTKIF